MPHATPAAFGAVTVMEGFVPEIVNAAFETSATVLTPAVAVTLITAADVAGPVGVQLQLVDVPGRLTHPVIGVKVTPLSRESATSIDVTPVLDHLMVPGVPTYRVSPPFGAVTLTVTVGTAAAS
jgi:hypothetical protein